MALCSYALAYKVITYQGMEVKWRDSDIPVIYYINENGTPDCIGGFAAIQAAYQTWEDVSCSYMDFTYGGTTSSTAWGNMDGINLNVWFESNWSGITGTGSNVIAVNTIWFSTIDGHLLDSDIAYNGENFTWSCTGEAGKMDIQNIATHEIGHSLALDDLYDPEDSEKTMYGYSSLGETKKRTLHDDDIAGICHLYPLCVAPIADFVGSPITGCIPLTVNFTDQSSNEPTSWYWDFGDGSTSDQQNPTHTYSTSCGPITYTVTLTVSNACGMDSETKTNYITVSTPPVVAFTANPTSGCSPLTVNFADQSTCNPTSWYWDFGDGSSSTQQNPSHTYNSTGNFTVTLTVSNACGSDSEIKTNYITVNTAPVADFTSSPRSGCAPLTVNFTDQSTNNPTSWAWSFGDGDSSSQQNPSHTYSSAGTYTVTLTASNACGSNSEQKINYITVNTAPVADFTGSTRSGCSPLTVDFTDQSTNNPTSWYWDFGDGNTSSQQNPTHTYSTSCGPTTYTVTLTVSNACGMDSETKTNYITVGTLPVAAFTANPTSGCSPLTVNFADQSTCNPTSWYWDFGDGQTSSQQNPMHIYTTSCGPATYTVTLTVTNECGVDSITKTNYITVSTPPVADFSADDTSGCSPLTVQFTDLSTCDPTSWLWDFGDGSTSNQQDPTHTYSTSCGSATYTVTLTIANTCGTDSITKINYITVNTPPVVDFSADDTSGCSPLTVQFTDLSTCNPTSWLWNFGDGNTSSLQNPIHTYSTNCGPTTYTVTLTVSNACGTNSETKTDCITVNTPPVADFTANLTSGCSPLTVTFIDQSTCNPTSWYWDFGDGSSSSLQNPHHTYEISCGATTYTVTLTVSNECGADSETKTNYITVGTPPIADFNANPTNGCSPLVVQFEGNSTCNPTSWLWKFGDGNSSTERNPSHTYFTYCGPTTYTVTLTIANECGIDSITKINYITVSTPPGADFLADDTSGCSPLTVQFTDLSTCNPTSWLWNFGDGNTSSQQNPTHTYGTSCGPTTYTVTLTVSNEWGTDSETKTNYITVDTPPVADFSADDTSGCSPLTVQFADLSTCNPTSWLWNFGDGQTSSQPNPTHTYGTGCGPTTYTVTLTVTNECGIDSITKINYITVSTPPVADFLADDTSGCSPLTVQFTDLSTCNPTSWLWKFGDGDSSTQQNPSHSYQNPGSYTVTLVVSNTCGSDTCLKSNYIHVLAPDIEVKPLEFHIELLDTEADTTSMTIRNRGPCMLNFGITKSDTRRGTSKSIKLDFYQEKTRTDHAKTHTLESNIKIPDIGWLSVNPASGSVNPNDSIAVEVIFNAMDIDTGLHTTYLLVNSNDPDKQTVSVLCVLLVYPAGVFEFSSKPIPDAYGLLQNYPNPFLRSTVIEYSLPENNYVNIKIFDITGSIVRTLVCKNKKAGYYKVIWDGRDTVGRDLPAGVYFCKFVVGNFTSTKKLILIR